MQHRKGQNQSQSSYCWSARAFFITPINHHDLLHKAYWLVHGHVVLLLCWENFSERSPKFKCMECFMLSYIRTINQCLNCVSTKILLFTTHILIIIGYLCYDDGCHLKKFANNPIRKDLTQIAKQLSKLSIVIDKMHFKGHIDPWCKENCNPYKYRECKDSECAQSGYFTYCITFQVDTEVCEQVFSWLSRYARITRHTNRETFLFYLLYLCDSHNRKL